MRHLKIIAALCGATLMLAACGGDAPNGQLDREDTGGGRLSEDTGGRLSDLIDLNSGSSDGVGGGLTPVNKYLWRASLDTLAFLPLNSTDPFTGVVATDWAASPDAPNERFKVTAYVKSPRLSASALQVAVFREIRAQDGVWASAPVSGVTARQLEDAILVRARQLKIQERESAG